MALRKKRGKETQRVIFAVDKIVKKRIIQLSQRINMRERDNQDIRSIWAFSEIQIIW